jgi:hypothetical protein
MSHSFQRFMRWMKSKTPAPIDRKIKSQITKPGKNVKIPTPLSTQTTSVIPTNDRKSAVSVLNDLLISLPQTATYSSYTSSYVHLRL